ncbi:MAG: hypothetical protein AAF320_01775 [Myxococcota bacterium]
MNPPQSNLQQAKNIVDALQSEQLVQHIQEELKKMNDNSAERTRLENKIIEQVTQHEKCLAKDASTLPYSQTLKGWNEAQRSTLNECNVLQKLFVFEFEKISSDIVCGVTRKDSPKDFEFFNIKMAGEFFKAGLSFGFWRLVQNNEGVLFIQFANLSCSRIRGYRERVSQWLQVGLSKGLLSIQVATQ